MTRWNDAALDQMRQLGDPAADAAVDAVFSRGQVEAVNALLGRLVDNRLQRPAHAREPAGTRIPAPAMKLDPQDLEKVAGLTLEHYNERAEEFWEGTRAHDVSQNIEALLQFIEGDPPFEILDLGCGPGRDLKAFAERGHHATGLEGAWRFAAMAKAHSGCDVWQQDLLKLDLPDERFDGVFANAALFHVPSQELPRVLLELRATLKPRGVLFASNPHGRNEEGWNGGRYGVYHDPDAWRRYLSVAGFCELAHYYRPAGLPRERQPWLASLWRKPAC